MNIIKYNLKLNNEDLIFFAPENDSVVPGTLAALQKNSWHFDRVDFKKDDIFVDIGCSIGLVSMFASKMFPFIKIYSFDANPLAIDCFRKSCVENNISNIEIFNLAVGSLNKKDVKFLTYSENESCLIERDLCTNERNFEYVCDMVSIDYIYDKILNYNNVKFLKIDIETGEFDLFTHIFGQRMDILKKTEFLHLEIHPLFGEKRSEILKSRVEQIFQNKVMF